MSKSKGRKLTIAPAKAPATAAAQALGYSLQYTRLTVMLLEAPAGTACSLEVLDDVEASSPDGRKHLVQSKSSLGDNPVSDRALSLWKTLHNWLLLIQRQLVDPQKTTFEIYVSREVSGEIVEAFHNALTIKDAREAFIRAREKLWGKTPNFPLKEMVATDLAPYLSAVFCAAEEKVLPMIVNMRLRCGSGSPQTDLLTILSTHPITPAKITRVADQLSGWVKRQLDTRLERALPAIIQQADFHREYLAYVRTADREMILKSFAPKPTETQKLEKMSEVFVMQLELVDADFDEKLEAVSDFLRACWDRTLWSAEGDVHEDSFKLLDDDLCRLWKNIRKQKLAEHETKEKAVQGKLIYSGCMLHQTQVQAMSPPPHFIPGCFHRLADTLEIGWHPDYHKALRQARVAEPV